LTASKTIDRIIGLYPKNEEPVIRTRLAQNIPLHHFASV